MIMATGRITTSVCARLCKCRCNALLHITGRPWLSQAHRMRHASMRALEGGYLCFTFVCLNTFDEFLIGGGAPQHTSSNAEQRGYCQIARRAIPMASGAISAGAKTHLQSATAYHEVVPQP